jgi:ribA/ribD-fused uncharacterized protein
MKYSVEWLVNKIHAGETVKYVLFWGHQPSRDGTLTATCFSQWWLSPFTVDGVLYRTAEHYMMAGKAKLFGDHETLQKILATEKPGEAKALGRTVVNFDPERWAKEGYHIVMQGSIHKFSSDAKLREFLLNTGDRVLVESSPVDAIWGSGHAKDHPDAERPWNWRGTNLLGFALMEARDALRKQT